MYEPNVERVLSLISPTDVVLDIGGWARPFNRANYVLDAEPYETRGFYGGARGAQGGDRECFSAQTWVQRDICDKAPFPFADKEIDFVVCSHVLEDIRDPLWVCAEMVRVAKRGYLEVPSREAESSRGIEPGQVGWTHHRWLVDIVDSEVRFLMKYHMIHSHWRFSFPESHLRALPEAGRVQWLFWDHSFAWSETTIHGVEHIASELAGYVHARRPYAEALVGTDRFARALWALPRRAARRGKRLVGLRA